MTGSFELFGNLSLAVSNFFNFFLYKQIFYCNAIIAMGLNTERKYSTVFSP